MDNRDEIIRTQLEVIGELINNSMRRVGDDFFGAPAPNAEITPEKPEPATIPVSVNPGQSNFPIPE